MPMIVPPGGFAGYAQMTPASRAAWSGRGTISSGGRRKKSRSKRLKRSATSARTPRRSGRKLKFGSPAWQKKYRVGKFAKKRR